MIMKKDKKFEQDELEVNLPKWLSESISTYQNGKDSSLWDCLYCELQSDINVAEQEQLITTEQAWFLRKKYLEISLDIDNERN